MNSKPINIKFIAEKANVSIATVSNVINQKGRVSEKTAERVRAVIEEFQYEGDLAARNLRTKKSYLFGVIVSVTKPERRLQDNPFYWELVSGIEAAARENEFAIVLKGIDSPEELSAFATQRNLDGIIVVGGTEKSPLVAKAKSLAIPAVYIDSYLQDPGLYQVCIDDEQGGYLAAEHLLELGHRKFAIVSGTLTPDSVNYFRWKGCKAALEQHGCDRDALVLETSTSAEGGYKAADRIIETFADATAVIAFSDITALGIYKRMHEKGYTIPHHFSVTGFDGIYFSTYMVPSLTTVKQDVGQKGMVAVELLFNQIQKPSRSENRRISLPVRLVTGGSTGPV